MKFKSVSMIGCFLYGIEIRERQGNPRFKLTELESDTYPPKAPHLVDEGSELAIDEDNNLRLFDDKNNQVIYPNVQIGSESKEIRWKNLIIFFSEKPKMAFGVKKFRSRRSFQCERLKIEGCRLIAGEKVFETQ